MIGGNWSGFREQKRAASAPGSFRDKSGAAIKMLSSSANIFPVEFKRKRIFQVKTLLKWQVQTLQRRISCRGRTAVFAPPSRSLPAYPNKYSGLNA
ncbi:hypothetical protein [Rhizobiales bacterium]|uniref:hypothetical protein n=1 Tax=Ensifer adhaerens TaxID=106592 RepID=UPI0013B018DB